MLSIIIPTLNEENYLGHLLASIKKQDYSDYEIIIADANSKDKTIDIAKSYSCKIVQGGLPAKGRNNGAKVAKGDLLLFLDADTLLPDSDFLNKTLEEFNSRNLGIAGFLLRAYSKNSASRFFLDVVYNFTVVASEKILEHSAVGILVKKDLFDKIGGYDEGIKLAEDHDLGRRASKHEKFGIIKSRAILVSDRRFIRDGWLKTGIKYALCELHLIFIGPVRSDIFNYRFDHYKEEKIK